MRVSKGKLVVHVFLTVYAVLLAYVILGLVFNYYISADIFFDLSFALLFFAAAQAIYELGAGRMIIFFFITSLIGYAAEVLGTSTGFPFGKYFYGDLLGEKIFGVPIVVPVVWFVIAYISLSIIKARKSTSVISIAALAALGAMAWDLLIDPMFSSPSYGYWTWSKDQFVQLPTLSGVPLTNFLGWFVLVLVMVSLFFYISRTSQVMKRRNTIDSYIVYVLLMIDGAVANLALGHTLVAIIGVSAMLLFIALNRSRQKETVTLKSAIRTG
ncbi:MAG: carotenoid biosynthesis protein [Nitrososphaerales archaeon]